MSNPAADVAFLSVGSPRDPFGASAARRSSSDQGELAMDVAKPSRLFAALLLPWHRCLRNFPAGVSTGVPAQFFGGVETRAGETRRSFFGCRPITRDGERHDARRVLVEFPLGTPSSDRDDLPPGKPFVRPGWWLFSPRVLALTTTPLRLR